MSFSEYLKKAVFFAKEKPELLANVLEVMVTPENLSENIVVPGISVDNGTSLTNAKKLLPTTLELTTSKGIPYTASVSWGSTTTPTYAASTAGDYVLEGTLSGLPAYVTNTGSKKATVTITVKAAA